MRPEKIREEKQWPQWALDTEHLHSSGHSTSNCRLGHGESRLFIDANTVPNDAFDREFDLCIVGSGPAGISLADRMRDRGLRIAMLEGGGLELQLKAQRLFRGEVVGRPYWPLESCRFRVFGGSGNRWGGMSRPLDPIDFDRRDWVADSGWPISFEAMARYAGPVAELLQLPTSRFDFDAWAGTMPPPIPLDGSEFEQTVFQYSPTKMDFGYGARNRVQDAETVTTLLHANVTGLRLVPGLNRVGAVEVATLTGRRFTVRARTVVLAAGGIENARLLLASRHDRACGLGNEHDLVGRYFAEHLHAPAGHLMPTSAAQDRQFYDIATHSGVHTRGVLTPTAAAQRKHRLLNCCIAIEPPSYPAGQPFLSWRPELTVGPERLYRRLRRGASASASVSASVAVSHGMRNAARSTWYAARSSDGRRNARRARAELAARGVHGSTLHSLYFRAEQSPNASSRVTLGERRDALGMPQAQLDWRLQDQDTESVTEWLKVLAGAAGARDLGVVSAPEDDWVDKIVGGPHHMGTTRMAADPRHGVVDENCRVHSVSNLYVAGCSVFPTGGYVNPTFSMLMLTLRLADHLSANAR